MRKAQAALEFIFTYGWALAIIAVVIGAFVYWGVADVDDNIPEFCTTSAGFSCAESGFIVDDTSGFTYAYALITNEGETDATFVDDVSKLEITGDCGSNTTVGFVDYSDYVTTGNLNVQNFSAFDSNSPVYVVFACPNMVEGESHKISFTLPYKNVRSNFVTTFSGSFVSKGSQVNFGSITFDETIALFSDDSDSDSDGSGTTTEPDYGETQYETYGVSELDSYVQYVVGANVDTVFVTLEPFDSGTIRFDNTTGFYYLNGELSQYDNYLDETFYDLEGDTLYIYAESGDGELWVYMSADANYGTTTVDDYDEAVTYTYLDYGTQKEFALDVDDTIQIEIVAYGLGNLSFDSSTFDLDGDSTYAGPNFYVAKVQGTDGGTHAIYAYRQDNSVFLQVIDDSDMQTYEMSDYGVEKTFSFDSADSQIVPIEIVANSLGVLVYYANDSLFYLDSDSTGSSTNSYTRVVVGDDGYNHQISAVADSDSVTITVTFEDGCWAPALDPSPICTCLDLDKMRESTSSDYSLQSDIDFNTCDATYGTSFTSGEGWEGSYLGGHFEGNDHSITGLFVNREANNEGLFSSIGSSSVLSNLFVSGDVTARVYAGGIAGANSGTIVNVTFVGNVRVQRFTSNDGYAAGGIAGRNSGTIRNVNFNGNATSENVNWVGGITAYMNSVGAQIINSSTSGIVTSGGYSGGGLVGNLASGSIVNSSSDMIVNCGYTYCGGVIGQIGASVVLENNTWVNYDFDSPDYCVGQAAWPKNAGTNPPGCTEITE